MGRAIRRAFAQLFSVPFIGIAAAGIAAAAVLFAGLFFATEWLIGLLPVLGWAWVNTVVAVIGGAGAIVLSLFLFQPVAVLFIGFFLEFIADAVEARYYPDAPAPRSVPLTESLLVSVRFLATSLVCNVLLLPVYLVPGINGLVFVAVNGYLVGREYFELVALRHLTAAHIRVLRKQNFWYLLGCGCLIAVALTVPVFNFVAPLFGTAFMVHIFRELNSFTEDI